MLLGINSLNIQYIAILMRTFTIFCSSSRSKQGVNKRSYWATFNKNNQSTEQPQHNQNGKQPIALCYLQELPKLTHE